jgi:hypothetical protein
MALPGKNKVWVIEDDELPIRPIKPSEQPLAQSEALSAAPRLRGSPVPPIPGLGGSASEPRPAGFKIPSRMRLPRSRAKTGALILLTYTLGVAAPLLIGKSRGQAFWSGLGVAGLMPWAALLFAAPLIDRALDAGRLPLLPWLAVMGLSALLLTTVWSRAIVLAGRDDRFAPDALPAMLRHPYSVGFAGLLVPGLGLLITGRPRRAALAFWIASPFVLSLLVLANTGRLGGWNEQGAEVALDGIVLAALVSAVLGALLWIGGALDGFRHALRESKKTQKRRNDWLVVALFASLVAFFLSLDPGVLAKDLDRLSWSRHEEGYRLVPLYLELAAMRLDPAEPAYVLRAADRYDEVGMGLSALTLRRKLRERWRAHEDFFLQKSDLQPKAYGNHPFEGQPPALDATRFPHQ